MGVRSPDSFVPPEYATMAAPRTSTAINTKGTANLTNWTMAMFLSTAWSSSIAARDKTPAAAELNAAVTVASINAVGAPRTPSPVMTLRRPVQHQG